MKTNNHKKLFILAAAFMALIITCALASCEEQEPDKISVNALHEKIENKTEAYITDLTDSRAALSSNEKIAKYIHSWAESKGIRVKTDGDLTVMYVDGSEEYIDTPRTVLICPYDELDFEGTVNSLTMTFYVLKNNEDTGRLTALFLPERAHDLSSYKSLRKKYITKGSNVICLSGDSFANVSRETGGASMYRLSNKYPLIKPKNKLAYKISISGIQSSGIDDQINEKINPIVELNSLLAAFKSQSIDFEIASFRGGTKGLLYPGSCTLVITVDEDRQAVIEKKIESKIDSFDKKKQTTDPEAVFEYAETKLPGKVLSQKDSANLAGFIYTLLEDEYHSDEDTDILMAVCDVSYIRIKNGKVRIGSAACSVDEGRLSEIDEAEETLCGLSGFRYKKTFSYPSWHDADETGLPESFRKGYKKYTGKKLKIHSQVTPSYASAVSELTGKCDILSVTVNPNTLTDLTGALMEYLIDSNNEEKKK